MKKLLLVYLIITLFFPGLFSQIKNDTIALLHPDNIIRITFDNNDRIKSAYYELEAAKYNFKLFESEYTQFNPLIVAPRINMNSAGQYSSDVVAGMQKEFFNGASISTAIGNNNSWGSEVETGNINFVETEIGFPLFSSSRALERIMKRTFEENELYTKNLDYVEAVRENIKEALEMYYDLVPRIKTYEALIEYQTELKTIMINDSTATSGTDQEQIEGEITNLTSKITGWEITLYSLQLNMQLMMNVKQMISTSESLKSWERAYAAKKELYLGNQESIENLLQTFRSLVETREIFLQLENNYLDLIRDLDYVCGVYFTVINLQNNMT